MVLITAAVLVVFYLFLIFSKITFMWLLLLMIPVIIFGFYLNYDLRTMVNNTPNLPLGKSLIIRLYT